MEQTATKKLTLKPYQYDFLVSEARHPALITGWGAGKTLALVLKADQLAMKYPKNLILICRREFTDLRDSTVRDFCEITKRSLTEGRDVHYENGSVIMFRHGDELDALQNVNLGAFGVEQGDEFDTRDNFDFLCGRLRRANVPFRAGFVIGNTNGHNWVHDIWKREKKGDPDYPIWEATTYDNYDVLPEDYLKSLKDRPESVYNQYVLNSWDEVSGRIYEEFDPAYHVIEPFEIPAWWERVGAVDTAVGPGTTAALACAVDPQGNLIFYAEHYEKNKLPSEHAKCIKTISDGIATWFTGADSFNRTKVKQGSFYSVADEYLEAGVTLVKGEQNVSAGILRVQEYLKLREGSHPYRLGLDKTPKLFIMRNCENLIREKIGYRYADLKPSMRGDHNPQPYKHDDHACDAARMLVMSRPAVSQEPKPVPLRRRWTVYDDLEREKELVNNWRGSF